MSNYSSSACLHLVFQVLIIPSNMNKIGMHKSNLSGNVNCLIDPSLYSSTSPRLNENSSHGYKHQETEAQVIGLMEVQIRHDLCRRDILITCQGFCFYTPKNQLYMSLDFPDNKSYKEKLLAMDKSINCEYLLKSHGQTSKVPST